jgi:hypothetical protein
MALASSFFIKLCQQRQLDVAAPGPPRLPAKPIETRLDFAAEQIVTATFGFRSFLLAGETQLHTRGRLRDVAERLELTP